MESSKRFLEESRLKRSRPGKELGVLPVAFDRLLGWFRAFELRKDLLKEEWS
jgi:hypothetical protein